MLSLRDEATQWTDGNFQCSCFHQDTYLTCLVLSQPGHPFLLALLPLCLEFFLTTVAFIHKGESEAYFTGPSGLNFLS